MSNSIGWQRQGKRRVEASFDGILKQRLKIKSKYWQFIDVLENILLNSNSSSRRLCREGVEGVLLRASRTGCKLIGCDLQLGELLLAVWLISLDNRITFFGLSNQTHFARKPSPLLRECRCRKLNGPASSFPSSTYNHREKMMTWAFAQSLTNFN